MKRIVISDESVNGRGFRVLTSGIRLERYEKAPVLLWMHLRGEVIGRMESLRVENGVLSGEPKFDGATDLSLRLQEQYEFGSVCACSMGVDVEEVADGFDVPVVTRCSLYEVSLVDVPENENSVTLRYQGAPMEVSGLLRLAHSSADDACGDALGPRVSGAVLEREIENDNSINKKPEEMKLSEMAVLLGLDAGASEEQVRDRASKLKDSHEELGKKTAELDALKAEQARAELAHVESLVDRAVREMRITAGKKQRYVELGKQVGSAALEQLLGDLRPVGKISEALSHDAVVPGGEWKKLSEVPEEELLTLRKTDPKKYSALYKAEYGIEPSLED